MKEECKKIYRSRKNVQLAGVCSGIAKYFNTDPTLVRIIWVLFSITTILPGIVLYIIFSIIIPKEPLLPDNIDFFDDNDI